MTCSTKRGIEIESYATHPAASRDGQPPCGDLRELSQAHDCPRKKDDKGNPTGEVLGMTLDLIHDTWEYSGNSLTAIFLDSIHKIIVAHADELDRKAFIAKLGGHRPEELREQALLLTAGHQTALVHRHGAAARDDRSLQ